MVSSCQEEYQYIHGNISDVQSSPQPFQNQSVDPQFSDDYPGNFGLADLGTDLL